MVGTTGNPGERAAVVLVLFGASAIPKFFHSLGKAKREFRKALTESEPEDERPIQGLPSRS